MKRVYNILFCVLLAFVARAQMHEMERCALEQGWRTGDLLFVVNVQGNAITAVTEGLDSLPIDHVAILINDSVPQVLEANYSGVVFRGLEQFAADNPVVFAGRVQGVDVAKSLANARTYLGKPYDYYFNPSDDEIYCSELVQKSYVDTAGRTVFAPIPMTFRNSKGEIPQYWVAHYAKRHLPIPEGAPGSNPAELSRREQVVVLGRPVQMQKNNEY